MADETKDDRPTPEEPESGEGVTDEAPEKVSEAEATGGQEPDSPSDDSPSDDPAGDDTPDPERPERPEQPEQPEKPERPDEPRKAEKPARASGEGDEAAAEKGSATQEPADQTSEDEDEAAAKAKAEAEAKAKAAAAAKAKAEAEAKKAAEEAAKDPWERDPQDPEWIDEDADPLVEALRASHGEAIVSARSFAGDLTLEIARASIREVAEALKLEHGYLLPVDICGAHYPDREEGEFEVVYHLYNFDANRRIRLKVRTAEDQEVPSVASVWRAANWPEREVYDMYGVRFSDHPDMTRILLWEGFNGYPLRKDFPVEGIDTGTAIYPEYYEDEAGPIAGTGTGWKVPEPPEPPEPEGPEPEPEETSEPADTSEEASS